MKTIAVPPSRHVAPRFWDCSQPQPTMGHIHENENASSDCVVEIETTNSPNFKPVIYHTATLSQSRCESLTVVFVATIYLQA